MDKFQDSQIRQTLDDLTRRREENGCSVVAETLRCHLCHDSGWIQSTVGSVSGVKACQCAIDARMKRKTMELPSRYWEASLENTPASQEQAHAMAVIRSNPNVNAYFYGNYESGKTHVLCIQFKELIRRGKKCFFRSGDQLVRELTEAVIDPVTPSPILQAIDNAAVGEFHLCWDDIDKCDWDRTPFRREAVGQLVDRIYRDKQGLSITTNYSIDEWAGQQKMPQFVLSRIDRLCRENMVAI